MDMRVEAMKKITAKIRDSLHASQDTWQIFCDTDGDRRPSPFTKIGYNLCDRAVVLLHLNKADLDRTETMLGVLHHLREAGEIHTQVGLVVWNFMKAYKNEPTTYRGQELPFTSTEVSMDILDACNERLYGIAKDLPGLFVHDAEVLGSVDWSNVSTAALKSLPDTVMKPSEELGVPFVKIAQDLAASGKKRITHRTGNVEYSSANTEVDDVEKSLAVVEQKLDALSLGVASDNHGRD